MVCKNIRIQHEFVVGIDKSVSHTYVRCYILAYQNMIDEIQCFCLVHDSYLSHGSKCCAIHWLCRISEEEIRCVFDEI